MQKIFFLFLDPSGFVRPNLPQLSGQRANVQNTEAASKNSLGVCSEGGVPLGVKSL
jgi:hypothetical protein